MPSILITGGSGCIGQETARWLLQQKNNTIISLSRGKTKAPSIGGICYEYGDILDLESLIQLIKRHRISHILHTAGLRTTDCEQDPHRAFEVNVMGTTNVFEAARIAGGIHKIVFTSTAAVYQVPKDNAFVCEDSAITPLNSYTSSKIAAENIAEFYATCYKIPTIVLRPQIIYGPDRNEGSTASVSHAIKHAQKQQPYHISFNGCYAFHYSADVGKCHGLALLRGTSNLYGIYNLPGESLNIEGICQKLNKLTSSNLITCEERKYPFAQGLINNKFDKVFGPFQVTPFDQVIRRSS